MSCSRQHWKLVEDSEWWLNISQAILLCSNIWTLLCSTFPHCALISTHLTRAFLQFVTWPWNICYDFSPCQIILALPIYRNKSFMLLEKKNLLISFWESEKLCTGVTDLNILDLKSLAYVIWAAYIFSFRIHGVLHINFEGCKNLTNVFFTKKSFFKQVW